MGAEEIPASFIVPALEDLEARPHRARGRGAARARRGAHLRHAAAARGAGEGRGGRRARTSPREVLGPQREGGLRQGRQAHQGGGEVRRVPEAPGGQAGAHCRRPRASTWPPRWRRRAARPRRSSRRSSTRRCTASTSASRCAGATWSWPSRGRVQWMVALLGGEVLPVVFGDVKSGRTTYGHRFLAPGADRAAQARRTTRRRWRRRTWSPDIAKRRALLRGAHRARRPSSAGGKLLEDESLVDQVTNLVELPNPVVGTFDERHLDLPARGAGAGDEEPPALLLAQDANGQAAAASSSPCPTRRCATRSCPCAATSACCARAWRTGASSSTRTARRRSRTACQKLGARGVAGQARQLRGEGGALPRAGA